MSITDNLSTSLENNNKANTINTAEDKALDWALIVAIIAALLAGGAIVRDQMNDAWQNNVFRHFSGRDQDTLKGLQEKINTYDGNIRRLEQLSRNPNLSDSQKLDLYYALLENTQALADTAREVANFIDNPNDRLPVGANFSELSGQSAAFRRQAEKLQQQVSDYYETNIYKELPGKSLEEEPSIEDSTLPSSSNLDTTVLTSTEIYDAVVDLIGREASDLDIASFLSNDLGLSIKETEGIITSNSELAAIAAQSEGGFVTYLEALKSQEQTPDISQDLVA